MTTPESDGNEETSGNATLTLDEAKSAKQMAWVERYTQLLDTQLVIPGTKIRFGADFILGLVPGIGDLVSLGMSGLLILTMAKNGASARLVVRMLGNVLLDTMVGVIPVIGNLFDLFFKANTRNVKLMNEYYREAKHRESVWPLLIGITLVLALFVIAAAYLMVRMIGYLWTWADAP